MRRVAAAVLVIALAGCGSSSTHSHPTRQVAGAMYSDAAGGFSARLLVRLAATSGFSAFAASFSGP